MKNVKQKVAAVPETRKHEDAQLAHDQRRAYSQGRADARMAGPTARKVDANRIGYVVGDDTLTVCYLNGVEDQLAGL